MADVKQIKICRYCSKPLPEGASFCPFCERIQDEPEEIRVPGNRMRPRRLILFAGLLLTAVLLLVLCVTVYRRPKMPQVYEGEASVIFPMKGKKYMVFLSFTGDAGRTGVPLASTSNRLERGQQTVAFSELFVLPCRETDSEDEKGETAVSISEAGAAREAFSEELLSCEVTAEPQDGAEEMQITAENLAGAASSGVLPVDAQFPPVYGAMISYGPECGTNTILWQLTMKNGDSIVLRQSVSCGTIPVLSWHYEDTPLETTADLKKLLKQIEAEEDPEAVLTIYLPPVSYDGAFAFPSRTFRLIGSSVGNARTTFTGSMQVNAQAPYLMELQNITFAGNGGTGLTANNSVFLENCTFTGWDTGAAFLEGSWPLLFGCIFEDNETGLLIDSHTAKGTMQDYTGITFRRNGTAIKAVNIPGNLPLRFADSLFEENERDLEDPQGLIQILSQ